MQVYKQQHPDTFTFSDVDTDREDTSLTRDERALEFELEKVIARVTETIKSRQQLYSTPGVHVTLPQVHQVTTISEQRAARNAVLDEHCKIPEPKMPEHLSELLYKEVSLSAEPKGNHAFILSLLIRFYTERTKEIPLRKNRLLYRWARHCGGSELLAKADVLLNGRLQRLDTEKMHVEGTLSRLHAMRAELVASNEEKQAEDTPDHTRTSISQEPDAEKKKTPESTISPTDLCLWLNSTAYDHRCKRKFQRFATKCNWLSISKRWELYTPIAESIIASSNKPSTSSATSSPSPDIKVPLLALTDEEVDPILEELTSCFNLRSGGDDGQEQSYTVNKGFATVFAAQTQSLDFSPYDLPTKKQTTAQSRRQDKEEGDHVKKIYLVHTPWASKSAPQQRSEPWADQLKTTMNCNVDQVDGSLKVEAKFLHETDAQYVIKRLLDQAANHVDRAKVTHKDESRERKANFKTAPPGPSLLKRQALYLLRYIRIRELRRRLLDILNYFVSLRKKLCLDSYGYMVFQADETQQKFATPLHNDLDGKPASSRFYTENTPEADTENTVEEFNARIKQYTINPAGHPQGSGVTAGPPPPLKPPCDIREDGRGTSTVLQSDGRSMYNLASLETRDDVYQNVGKNIVVEDRYGQTIMYDLALKDLSALEAELLLIGTHFIGAHTPHSQTSPDIDRVTVLEDLYESEAWFQEGKRKLVDQYLEAYEHVCSKKDQVRLSKIILGIIEQRPVVDLHAPYFAASYSNETILQELHHSLLREIINAQIADEKRLNTVIHKKNTRDGSNGGGWLEHAGHPELSVSDTRLYQCLFSGSSVVNVLDFYSSLAVLAELPALIQNTADSLIGRFTLSGNTDPHLITLIKQQVCQQFLVEWKILQEEERVCRQLQTSSGPTTMAGEVCSSDFCFIDNAATVSQVVHEISMEQPTVGKKNEVKVDEKLVSSVWYDVVEAFLCRSQLLDALYESEVLFNIQRKQGMIMGVEVRKFHFDSMDFETKKSNAEIDECSEVDVEMSEVVSYKTEHLLALAITEFERGMGQFDFHSSDGFKKILCFGIGDLRRALTVQLSQKNMLISAALFNQVPIDSYFEKMVHAKIKPNEREPRPEADPIPETAKDTIHSRSKINISRVSAEAIQNGVQTSSGEPLPTAGLRRQEVDRFPPYVTSQFVSTEQLQSLFLSVNHIKSTHRKRILEELNTRTTEVLRAKRPELLRKKMKTLKHTLINEYCLDTMTATAPYLLKWQVARMAQEIKKQAHIIGGMDEMIVLGDPKDTLEVVASGTGHTRAKGTQWSGTCLLALDGRVEEVRYVPHYVQVYRHCQWGAPAKEGAAGINAGIMPSGTTPSGTHCTDVADNIKTVKCLTKMLEILHHVYSIMVYCKVLSKLTVTAAVAADLKGGLEGAPKEYRTMLTELETLIDLSDTSTVASWLQQYHSLMHLRLYLSSSSVRQACLAPRGGSKPLRTAAALIGTEADALEHANAPAHPPVFVNEVAAAMQDSLELVDTQLPMNVPTFRSVWHAVVSSDSVPSLITPDPAKAAGDAQGAAAPPAALLPQDRSFYESLMSPFLASCEACPYRWLESFLIRAGDDDRHQVLAEHANLNAFLNEVKNDQMFVEEMTLQFKDKDQGLSLSRACLTALHVHARRELLKGFYASELQIILNNDDPSETKCDEAFLKMMHSKARAQYEADLQETDESKDARAYTRRNRRNRTEIGLRKKQVAVLRQEINKLLIASSVAKTKQLLAMLHTAANNAHSGAPNNSKLDFFIDFHTMMMAKGGTSRDVDGSLTYHISSDVLGAAVDQVGVHLKAWEEKHLNEMTDTFSMILLQHRNALFKAEQKITQLDRLRELDQKALARRVAARVNDEKYILIFQRNSLQKQNDELKDKIASLELIVRDEVKTEYEEIVAKLRSEISLLHGQFKDHKRKLYREMQINLEEIKRHAMMSIGKSEVAPLHMKRQALRIAINDEEANKLKEQNAELQMTVAKLNLWHEMKLSNIEAYYQKKLVTLEREKEEASSRYWGNKEKVEEKEELMRQQLHATQKSLSATEMEVEQLLRDLDLQERKKKHLVTWKVAHSKQLEELSRRAKRYEKYEKYDIDRLLRSMEKEDAAGAGPSPVAKSPVSPLPDTLQPRGATPEPNQPQNTSREVARLKEELKRERRLKMKAFLKLDQLREDQEVITDEMVWQKKYFECASELQRALRDLQHHRDHLTNIGIAPPPLQKSSPPLDLPSPASSVPTGRNLPDLGESGAKGPTRPTTSPGLYLRK